jgi:hypothetical protein
MKSASIKEIKTEISRLHPDDLMELCLRMAKFKKENKELLTYLLFESVDEKEYIRNSKLQIDELFIEVNRTNSYQAKKTIRKILRLTQKQIKYSGIKQTEVELLIYFCKKLKKLGIPMPINSTLGNMYLRQYQKINKTLLTLHEDLQFDYIEEIKLLQ